VGGEEREGAGGCGLLGLVRAGVEGVDWVAGMRDMLVLEWVGEVLGWCKWVREVWWKSLRGLG
jgi:hypothetical protein